MNITAEHTQVDNEPRVIPGGRLTIGDALAEMARLEAENLMRQPGYVRPIIYVGARSTEELMSGTRTRTDGAAKQGTPAAEPVYEARHSLSPKHERQERTVRRFAAETLAFLTIKPLRALGRVAAWASAPARKKVSEAMFERKREDKQQIRALGMARIATINTTLSAAPRPAETIDNTSSAPRANRRPTYTPGTFRGARPAAAAA